MNSIIDDLFNMVGSKISANVSLFNGTLLQNHFNYSRDQRQVYLNNCFNTKLEIHLNEKLGISPVIALTQHPELKNSQIVWEAGETSLHSYAQPLDKIDHFAIRHSGFWEVEEGLIPLPGIRFKIIPLVAQNRKLIEPLFARSRRFWVEIGAQGSFRLNTRDQSYGYRESLPPQGEWETVLQRYEARLIDVRHPFFLSAPSIFVSFCLPDIKQVVHLRHKVNNSYEHFLLVARPPVPPPLPAVSHH